MAQEMGRVTKTKGLPEDRIRERRRLVSNSLPSTRAMHRGVTGKPKPFIKKPIRPKAIITKHSKMLLLMANAPIMHMTTMQGVMMDWGILDTWANSRMQALPWMNIKMLMRNSPPMMA